LRASANARSCGHDHRARHGHALGQRELDVTSPRRHVDHEVVELAPGGIPEQLRQGLRHHRAAPDHRLARFHEETDGHRLEAMRLERHQVLAVGGGGPLPLEAQHQRLAGPVDVGIEDADAGASGCPGECQVGRDRRLAHAALAARDRDDIAHPRQRLERPLDAVGDDGGAQITAHGAPREARCRQVRSEASAELLRISAHRDAQFDRSSDLALRDPELCERARLR
jgi:hypothetical protein